MTQQARCRRHGSVLDFSTDNIGRLVEWCEKCDRARRSLCIDCGHPAQHKRCGLCNRLFINLRVNSKRARICRLKGCGAPVRIGSKRYYCTPEHSREAKLQQYTRRYATNREFRERCRRRRERWRASAAGLRSYYKGKKNGRLLRTWGYKTREDYLRAQAKANNHHDRKEKRRAWALANQRRFNEHDRPVCATCGVLVEWSGCGRPRKYCPPCHPWRKS